MRCVYETTQGSGDVILLCAREAPRSEKFIQRATVVSTYNENPTILVYVEYLLSRASTPENSQTRQKFLLNGHGIQNAALLEGS